MNWFDSKRKTISVSEGILTHNHRITDFMLSENYQLNKIRYLLEFFDN